MARTLCAQHRSCAVPLAGFAAEQDGRSFGVFGVASARVRPSCAEVFLGSVRDYVLFCPLDGGPPRLGALSNELYPLLFVGLGVRH
eukprot:6767550-Alexandrium_andersonii.AAC.1